MFFLIFFIKLIYFFIKNSNHVISNFYLDYIISLNYWDSNLFYIIVIFLVFFNVYFYYGPLVVFITLMYLLISPSLPTNICIVDSSLIYTLWSGTIMLHPIYLYCSLVWFSFYYLRLQVNTKYFLNYYSYMCIIALFLGCLWGSQSSAWGYFWVNDYIEWFLLILYGLIVLCFHTIFISKKTIYANIAACVLFLFLLYIRLDLFPTRHSFFDVNITMYVINYIYVYIYCIAIFYFGSNYINARLIWIFFFIYWCFMISLKLFFFILCIYVYNNYFFFFSTNYTKVIHFFFFNFFFFWCLYYLLFITSYKVVNFLLTSFFFYYKSYYLNFRYGVFFVDNFVLDLINFTVNFTPLNLQPLCYSLLNSVFLSSIIFIEIYIYVFLLKFNKYNLLDKKKL